MVVGCVSFARLGDPLFLRGRDLECAGSGAVLLFFAMALLTWERNYSLREGAARPWSVYPQISGAADGRYMIVSGNFWRTRAWPRRERRIAARRGRSSMPFAIRSGSLKTSRRTGARTVRTLSARARKRSDWIASPAAISRPSNCKRQPQTFVAGGQTNKELVGDFSVLHYRSLTYTYRRYAMWEV
jgi:hypothetical protein